MDTVTSGTQPPTIRLEDYRPPAYLVETVALEFDLGEAVTRVRAKVAFVRNPSAAKDSALVLNGDGLRLVSLSVDGKPLSGNAYALDEKVLAVPRVPERF